MRLSQCKCKHGADPLSLSSRDNISLQFAATLEKSFLKAAAKIGDDVCTCYELVSEAKNDAAMDGFAEVWHDSAKMETVMSYLLCDGAQEILDGNYSLARLIATITRYLQKETMFEFNWTIKMEDTYHADLHTLVKFFRKRIPCSCLDEKYKEVKRITKVSCCNNPECSIPNWKVERSKTMCCSRCRCAIYCSRKCQVANWTKHKPICDECVAMKVKMLEFVAHNNLLASDLGRTDRNFLEMMG